MTYWSLLEKFQNNPSSINGWYSRGYTHTHTNTEGKNNNLANPFGARLIIAVFNLYVLLIVAIISADLGKTQHRDWHHSTKVVYWFFFQMCRWWLMISLMPAHTHLGQTVIVFQSLSHAVQKTVNKEIRQTDTWPLPGNPWRERYQISDKIFVCPIYIWST